MRLIDADDFKVFLQSLVDAGAEYGGVIELLERQPMVYNVNKVVERLEECKSIMLSPTTMNCFGTNCEYNDCLVCVFEKAIEIVRNS